MGFFSFLYKLKGTDRFGDGISVILAQLEKKFFRKQGIAIFAAFAVFDFNQHSLTWERPHLHENSFGLCYPHTAPQ